MFGFLFLLAAAFMLSTGRGSRELMNMCFIVGGGQLLLFKGIAFYLYRKRLKNAS